MNPENNFIDYMIIVFAILIALTLVITIIFKTIEFFAKKFGWYDKISEFFNSDND
ncbi:MAG: hypothetical protein K2M17_02815 [Bacilli bacterium]|nr:hypothetical protein [Bacilli bacterium]